MSDLSLKRGNERITCCYPDNNWNTAAVQADFELLQHSLEKGNMLAEISVNFHVYFHSVENKDTGLLILERNLHGKGDFPSTAL